MNDLSLQIGVLNHIVVDYANVAGEYPTISVDGLSGLVGQPQVPREHVASPCEYLAVLGNLHLDTRRSPTDITRLGRC